MFLHGAAFLSLADLLFTLLLLVWLCLQEVQLPPVEGDPFAAAKAAKYSMSSIPSSARKQLNRSNSVPNKNAQGSSSISSSPNIGAAAAAAAGPSAAQLAGAGMCGSSSCIRSASDTAALMHSGSAAAAAAAAASNSCCSCSC